MSGETHLRRAKRIAESHPDADWQLVEDTLLALGDYYVLSGRPNRGSRIYGETWTLLSEGGEQERLKNRREHLERPVILQDVYPAKYLNSDRKDEPQEAPPNFETSTISIGYTVEPSGRISDMRLVESRPVAIGEFDKRIARSLRRIIYRPRLEEGKIVPTNNIVYTHEFFYRPSDLETETTDTDPSEEQTSASDDATEEVEDR